MLESSEYVQSRRMGDVTISVINDAFMPAKLDLTVPEEVWRPAVDADSEGKVPSGSHVVLVQAGDATILVDAGLDDSETGREDPRLAEWPGPARTPGVVAGLATLGITPEGVTHILVTHVHFDHVFGLAVERDGGFVPRYPNARVFIGRADWENAPEEHLGSDQRARIRAIEEVGLLELVDAERTVVPGVTMIPAPGESPGHSIIRVSSNGAQFYAVGDLFHHGIEIEHLDWMVPWADPEQMATSRRAFMEAITSNDALVVFTHEEFPPWGRITGDVHRGYRWERD